MTKNKSETCAYPNCKRIHTIRFEWANRGLCALHYDRHRYGVDLGAPIRPANINKIITGEKDEKTHD